MGGFEGRKGKVALIYYNFKKEFLNFIAVTM